MIAKAPANFFAPLFVVTEAPVASPATTVTSSPTNGATTEFYRAVKKVGGVPKAKELLANIEAFQNA